MTGSETGPSTDASASLIRAIIAAMTTKRERVRAFMEEHVYPNEPVLFREDEAADALIAELQGKVKAAGLWAPHLPAEAGGSGAGFLEYADLNEEIGRSFIAQLIFGCQAPDAGNGEILHLYGTPEQRERFLEPLVRGEVRSFFGMTEPEVAGSDPTLLRGRAVRDGDEWVIDAHKWFSSGADGAAFGVVMLVTDPDAEPHRRASMILVPTDTPGYEMVRRVPVMGHEGRGWGTHCETRFTGVRVPVANTLGEPGDGFKIAQKRLGPGRIHHVMRWLGQMQRAFELMCTYSLEREAHGGPLADKQTVQNWIAESAAEIQACRLMTMQAAQRIDEGDEARVEVSLIKFYAARVLQDVVDRALQVHGGLGMTDDTPLALMWRMARGGRIYDGPDEVHKSVVARRILKSFAEGDGWRFT
jgi:alkylation response protein AidB-like acyl-CoA dehydrogenase